MEILKIIGEWALGILIVVVLWKPFWRFVGNAADNAYGKAVKIGGTLILIVALSLIVYLLKTN